eukprot:CFRG6032T1
MDDAKRMLDELMGRNRNATEADAPKDIHFTDPEVCKFHLVDVCPHDLFTNTKSDLGFCHSQHLDDLKVVYKNSSQYRKLHYEEKYLRHLQSLIAKMDRKIKDSASRLEPAEGLSANNEVMIQDLEEKVKHAGMTIDELLETMERLGEEGKVDESQALMKQVEEERIEQDNFKLKIARIKTASTENENKMTVCDVCGAMLSTGELNTRQNSHMTGKSHMGYQLIRDKIVEYQGILNDLSPSYSSFRETGANAIAVGGADDHDRVRERDRGDSRRSSSNRRDDRYSRDSGRDRSRTDYERSSYRRDGHERDRYSRDGRDSRTSRRGDDDRSSRSRRERSRSR